MDTAVGFGMCVFALIVFAWGLGSFLADVNDNPPLRRRINRTQARNVACIALMGVLSSWETALWFATGWYGLLSIYLLVCLVITESTETVDS